MRVEIVGTRLIWAAGFVVLATTGVMAADGEETSADRELATEARLPTILRVIGERSPDLREASERRRAAEARTGATGRLPDPELKGELWGVPLAHPLGFDQANTIMIGLRQSFPAWGSLDARERAAREDAGVAGDAAEARR
ncbi:MAG: Heavy metal efflux outer membrane protein CzcC family protein, partial [Myxococcales bacterium]|nr:Heavy metal efflux outer membrane protein CzcC family protein [Myxococcales bacterium]